MRNKFYQNDFPQLEGVAETGCLYMSLLDMVQEELLYQFNRRDIESIYKLCNERGMLGTENSKNDLGAFVWDHTGVLNMACIVIGRKDITWSYLARIYSEVDEARGFESWTNDPEYIKNCTGLILQVKIMESSMGHFLRFNYDPWKTRTKPVHVKSVRYYKVNK